MDPQPVVVPNLKERYSVAALTDADYTVARERDAVRLDREYRVSGIMLWAGVAILVVAVILLAIALFSTNPPPSLTAWGFGLVIFSIVVFLIAIGLRYSSDRGLRYMGYYRK